MRGREIARERTLVGLGMTGLKNNVAALSIGARTGTLFAGGEVTKVVVCDWNMMQEKDRKEGFGHAH